MIGLIRVVGILVAVGVIMILGIKYMMGSVSEKAAFKENLVLYIVGFVLLVATTILPATIYDILKSEEIITETKTEELTLLEKSDKYLNKITDLNCVDLMFWEEQYNDVDLGYNWLSGWGLNDLVQSNDSKSYQIWRDMFKEAVGESESLEEYLTKTKYSIGENRFFKMGIYYNDICGRSEEKFEKELEKYPYEIIHEWHCDMDLSIGFCLDRLDGMYGSPYNGIPQESREWIRQFDRYYWKKHVEQEQQ